MPKKIKLGKVELLEQGILSCKLSNNGKQIICKTSDGFDYYGEPHNERHVGAYTSIGISTDENIYITPGKDGLINIFGIPVECEEPPITDEPYVEKGTKLLTCRTRPGINNRVQEMAEKGEISGQVAYYLLRGEWAEES